MYSAHDHLIGVSDFMGGIYIHKHPTCLPVEFLAYMPNLAGIFFSAIACKIAVAVVVMWHMCGKRLGLYVHLPC